MPNYVLAYHGGGMAQTDEARAQELAAWGAWYQQLGGAVVDGGNPVGRSKTIDSSGAVSDGGGANPVTGYTIIKADDFDGAIALAKDCPILRSGGSVEVGETFVIG